MGHLQYYQSVRDWESTSSPSWLVWTIPRRGQSSLWWEDIQTKGSSYRVFQNFNLIGIWPLENVRLVNKQAGKKFSWNWDWTKRKSNAALSYPAGNNSRWLLRVQISEAPVILADEPTRKPWRTDSHLTSLPFEELAKGRQKCVIVVTHSRKWRRPPMWSWNWVAVALSRRAEMRRGILCCAMLLLISHVNGPSLSCSLPSFSSWGPWAWSDSLQGRPKTSSEAWDPLLIASLHADQPQDQSGTSRAESQRKISEVGRGITSSYQSGSKYHRGYLDHEIVRPEKLCKINLQSRPKHFKNTLMVTGSTTLQRR